MTADERERAVFFHTYKRLPLELERGEGMYLITRDGSRYLDMFAGVAVNALGHGHPGLRAAILAQTERYIHVSNYFLQEPQIRLAELLCNISGYTRVFFANSGTEAIEGVLKIARRWGSVHSRNAIVSLSNAFHGRTFGALSLMDRPRYREGFEPLLPGCTVVEFNNVPSLLAGVNSKTTAVILEFIQGEGGIRPISSEFADTLKSLKEQFGFLLVADEIQSGIGRTGKFFGFEHFGLRPDLVVVAKPLGGGLPIGAILGTEALADVLQPGMHGSTFGGNPVACAAGAVVIEEVVEKGLMENASLRGSFFVEKLRTLQNEFPSLVKDVRGYGLMIGMELVVEADPIVAAMREKKILINATDQTVLRFIPPLIVQNAEIDLTIAALREVFSSR